MTDDTQPAAFDYEEDTRKALRRQTPAAAANDILNQRIGGTDLHGKVIGSPKPAAAMQASEITESTSLNQIVGADLIAREENRRLRNQLLALAHEVKRIAVNLKLDEEALDRDMLQNKLYAADARAEAAEADRDALRRELESLTPGGSEFYNSPDNCVRFIRDRLATTAKIAKERNDLTRRAEEAEALLRRIAQTGGKTGKGDKAAEWMRNEAHAYLAALTAAADREQANG